jgi:AraC-like DNA-binding protein
MTDSEERLSSSASSCCRPSFSRLLTTDAFTVREFRCPGTPAITAYEAARYPEIVLPRIGAYVRHDAAGSLYLDRTVLAFFEGGRPYRIEHVRRRPDITTVISLRKFSAAAQALGVCTTRRSVFPRCAVPVPRRVMIAHQKLLALIDCGDAARLEAEETASELVEATLTGPLRIGQELCVPNGSRRQRDIVFAIAEYIQQRFAEPIRLADLSRHVGLSSFHLCRLFRYYMRRRCHEHLTAFRLQVAAEQLAQSDRPITAIAMGCGFSSHSHFADHFRRVVGMSPSVFRLVCRRQDPARRG